MGMVAQIDPQWPPIITAFTGLLVALGWSERRRQRDNKKRASSDEDDQDRRAAETILTQWKAVLEAVQARADWERDEHQRCEKRNEALTVRVDELEEKARAVEWELARRDWVDAQPRRKRGGDGRSGRDPSGTGSEPNA